jgi:hypothetical protein
MFVVTDAEAAAIRSAFERGGELSATVELRRLFPGVTDTAKAREPPSARQQASASALRSPHGPVHGEHEIQS